MAPDDHRSTRPAVDGRFSEAETFGLRTTFGEQMRRMIGLTVMMLVVVFLLAAAILHALGVDNAAAAGGVAVVFVVLAVLGKKRQWDAKFAQRTLLLDPAGAHIVDRDFTIDLPWQLVDGVGVVPELRVWRLNTSSGRRIANAANAAQGGSEGLLGAGTLTPTPAASAAFRSQIRQNLDAARIDGRTGQPAFGVPLAVFDRSWQLGRIGEWVAHHCPPSGAR